MDGRQFLQRLVARSVRPADIRTAGGLTNQGKIVGSPYTAEYPQGSVSSQERAGTGSQDSFFSIAECVVPSAFDGAPGASTAPVTNPKAPDFYLNDPRHRLVVYELPADITVAELNSLKERDYFGQFESVEFRGSFAPFGSMCAVFSYKSRIEMDVALRNLEARNMVGHPRLLRAMPLCPPLEIPEAPIPRRKQPFQTTVHGGALEPQRGEEERAAIRRRIEPSAMDTFVANEEWKKLGGVGNGSFPVGSQKTTWKPHAP